MTYKQRRDILVNVIRSGVTGYKNIAKVTGMCVKTISAVTDLYPEVHHEHKAQLDKKSIDKAESYRSTVEAIEALRLEGVCYPDGCKRHGMGYTSFLKYRKALGIKQVYWEMITH